MGPRRSWVGCGSCRLLEIATNTLADVEETIYTLFAESPEGL